MSKREERNMYMQPHKAKHRQKGFIIMTNQTARIAVTLRHERTYTQASIDTHTCHEN